jgi:hypothetical protein
MHYNPPFFAGGELFCMGVVRARQIYIVNKGPVGLFFLYFAVLVVWKITKVTWSSGGSPGVAPNPRRQPPARGLTIGAAGAPVPNLPHLQTYISDAPSSTQRGLAYIYIYGQSAPASGRHPCSAPPPPCLSSPPDPADWRVSPPPIPHPASPGTQGPNWRVRGELANWRTGESSRRSPFLPPFPLPTPFPRRPLPPTPPTRQLAPPAHRQASPRLTTPTSARGGPRQDRRPPSAPSGCRLPAAGGYWDGDWAAGTKLGGHPAKGPCRSSPRALRISQQRTASA